MTGSVQLALSTDAAALGLLVTLVFAHRQRTACLNSHDLLVRRCWNT